MPNLPNAKKALRQSKKRAERNQLLRDEIHSLRRAFRKAIEAGSLDEAKKMIQTLDKKLDKLVTKKVFKKKKVARIKSRLQKTIQRASAK